MFLGILATDPNYLPDHEKVIVSIDKDMMQIPGRVFAENKALDNSSDWESAIVDVTEQAGRYKHWEQTLCGDVVDGYKGCPGIGPKTVEKLLDESLTEIEAWAIISAQYIKKNLSEDELLAQARVAKILTYNDYDAERNEVRLFKLPI